jgi:oligopeptidase B
MIREEYTHPSLLFISTSSAGSIAAWNAISRKPHLYKGAILRFPFLDVLNSLMDSSQPLSNADYE